jgi:lipoprotein-releasing system permease protein
MRSWPDVEAANHPVQVRNVSIDAFVNQRRNIDTGIRFVKRIAYAFGGVIFAIACGLLWNTISRIVSDSRADIGLFRALGATKQDIRRLFLSEAALLGLLGTLTGMVLGWTVAFYISRWVIHAVRGEISDPEQLVLLPDSVFSIDVRFCLELLVIAAAVSVLAGWVPANRAAKVDPIKALKRE